VQRPADIRYLLGGPAVPRKCHILTWDICTRARSTFARALASVPFVHFVGRFLIHFLHCLFIVGGFCYNFAQAILQQVVAICCGGVSYSPSCNCLIWAILCGLGSFSLSWLLFFAVSLRLGSFSSSRHFLAFLIPLADYAYHLLAFGAIWFVFLHVFFHQWAGGVIVSASSSGGLEGGKARESGDYWAEEFSGKRKSWIWF
jgi:hypothetical protein